jgi:hypothetical protein
MHPTQWIITLEEHFMSSHMWKVLPNSKVRLYSGMSTSWLAKLEDVSVDERIIRSSAN